MKFTKPFTHFFTLFLVIILTITLASACDSSSSPSNQENLPSSNQQTNNNNQTANDDQTDDDNQQMDKPAEDSSDSGSTDSQPTEADSPPEDSPPESPTIPYDDLFNPGPWFVFPAQDSMWAFNQNGSGIIPLYFYPDQKGFFEVSRVFAAPTGGRVALLLIQSTSEFTTPSILIFNLPNGMMEAKIPLLSNDWDYSNFTTRDEKDAAEQLYAAVGVWNDPVWSNDGTMLAFSAAIDGPTSDLYVYNTTDESTLRLTSGSSESVDPVFTITDSHIIHGAVSSLNYGYSGAGYDYQHVWAARPDGSGVNKVFNHDFYGYENILGWTGYLSYLGESWENWCYSFNLRKIDINDGEQETLYAGHYTERAFAQTYEQVLFAIPSFIFDMDCITDFQPGVYMMETATGTSSNIPLIPVDDVTNITWQERSELFFVLTNQGTMYTVSPFFAVDEYQAPKGMWNPPIFNLAGTKWAYVDSGDDLLVIGGLDGEYIQLDVESPSNPIWSPDSQWLFFFADHKDGRTLYAAPAPNYNPIVVESGILIGSYAHPPVIVNP